MRVLSDYQKEFLLDYFFEKEGHYGWRNIATKLLETGQCIVAGNECIWVGGIGNFIKTEEAEDAVDCTLHTFNLNDLLASKWYKGIRDYHISSLSNKKQEIEKEYEEINKLVNLLKDK